jgi:hypothetical protein
MDKSGDISDALLVYIKVKYPKCERSAELLRSSRFWQIKYKFRMASFKSLLRCKKCFDFSLQAQRRCICEFQDSNSRARYFFGFSKFHLKFSSLSREMSRIFPCRQCLLFTCGRLGLEDMLQGFSSLEPEV